MRFDAAKKHNAALISQDALRSELEIDPFDSRAIHIGSFANGALTGCIRLCSASQQSVFHPKYLSYRDSFDQVRRKEQQAMNSYCLPSSRFLEGEELHRLETYFYSLLLSQKKISESGRFINLEEEFNPRLVRAMLCYVWAMNLYFDVDMCFFNTTPDHARYYKRLFNCKSVFPELAFDTGAKDVKQLLYADILNPPQRQVETIGSILDSFANSQELVEYSFDFELVEK